MKDNKLVSVVIPSYNHEKYIEQAIDSVFRQNYRPMELIVVDDQSRDRSPEIISALKERYRKLDKSFNFTFIRTKKNSDAPTTINLGLSKARGEFVAILNSDDYYAEDRIKTLVEAAYAKNRDLLFTDVEVVDSQGVKLPGQHPRAHWLHQALSFRHELPSIGFMILRRPHVVTTGNLFFKRSLLKKLRGFRHYRWHHDWDFVLRATRFTEPFFISKRLLSYRIHESNTITEMENSSKEIGRMGDARSDSEIRRIIEDFYEESMMTSSSAKPGLNPLAPIPEFWPSFFLNFFKHQQTWYSGVPYLKEISLCNRSLLENQDLSNLFFHNAGMTKEDIIQSLRVFPDVTYMHIENFPQKALKSFPAIRFVKSTQLNSMRSGQIGTIVTLTAKFKRTAPPLAESFIAIFRGNRLASVARAVSKKENTLTYLCFLVEPLTKGEDKKLKFCLIESNRHLDYTLYLPKLPKKKKKKVWRPAIRSHFGNIDHLNASGTVLAVGGWSAHNGELPISLRAYFNGKPIPTLPSLYFRPDLAGLLEHPNKTSIAGFRFWFDFGYLRVFEMGEGVLEIRSEFNDIRGVLDRFHISPRKKGLVIRQEGPHPVLKKARRKRKS